MKKYLSILKETICKLERIYIEIRKLTNRYIKQILKKYKSNDIENINV